MKKVLPLLLPAVLCATLAFGQAASVPILNVTNIAFTDANADPVLRGSYTASSYNPTTLPNVPDSAVKALMTKIVPDSIKSYWLKLGTFYNRNSGNQLASTTQGITASIDWVNSKFDEFNIASGNRLVVSDMTFTTPSNSSTCNRTTHKQPLLIIPGSSTTDKSILVVCGHIDSRGNSNCTPSTEEARGMEDNATGVASIMELARVMSKYRYPRTIVFLITTLEEQSLGGAAAFARYCSNNSISVRGNINNDQLGTMICLTPASQPGCTANNTFDTTNIRIFSNQNASKPYAKAWARYIKLAYQDKALPTATVPMTINLMANLDRTNRGGDHMAFDTLGFTAARVMCANEAGDGSGGSRIHTALDIGGRDNNSDGILDSFYVGFNYMQRNAMIDGLALAMASHAQTPPVVASITNIRNNNIQVVVNTTGTNPVYPYYRIAVRTASIDYDNVYLSSNATTNLLLPVSSTGSYRISVAGLDAQGVTTFFSPETVISSSATTVSLNYKQFDAVKKGNTAELLFKISEPAPGSTFFIERSDNATNFKTLGVATENGTNLQFKYTDAAPLMNSINYYRIRQADAQNAVSYSSIASLKFMKEDPIQVFPVPSFESATVVFTELMTEKPTMLFMYSDNGQMVLAKNLLGTKGKEVIDVSEMRNGHYIIKIQTAKGIVSKPLLVVR